MLTDIDRIDTARVKQIVEGALMAADGPLSVDRLCKLFRRGELDPAESRDLIREALRELDEDAAGRGYELKRVASGFRFQVRAELSAWISRLWEEKPPRYSRALLETLALIAYRQPLTRGDIEQVRGVAVSSGIMRTLTERGWIRIVGQRETPGRPNLYATSRAFLDSFNLKSLSELPPLEEIRSMIEPLAEAGEGDAVTAGESGVPDQADAFDGELVQSADGDTVPAQDDPEDQDAVHLAKVVQLPTASRQSPSLPGE